jgi:hypothetical protein
MAHNTDFPDLEGARATTLNGISLYIWRAAIFRVPLSTLQNRTEDGSTELIDVAAHCRALVLTRFWVPRYRSGSLTAEWLNVWASLSPRTNSPHIRVIPRTVEYLGIYFHEWEIWNPRGRPKEGGLLTHCGRVTKISVFNTVKLGTSASSP